MAKAQITGKDDVGHTWKAYGASTVNLITDAASPGTPARRLKILADGDFSMCKDCGDNDRPILGLKAGDTHDAYVSEVTCSVGFVAYW